MEATLGLHGEYLLPMAEDFDPALLQRDPMFDLRVDPEEEVGQEVHSLERFDAEEHIFFEEDSPVVETKEELQTWEKKIKKNHFNTMELEIQNLDKGYNAYVTRELHGPKHKVIWEVYCGRAKVSKIAEAIRLQTEEFGFQTGWNFDKLEHQQMFSTTCGGTSR